jgi:hypothetical protein
MQNSYVHNAGQWHLVDNTYAHHSGQWHLVQNAYVHYNGQWHLAQSAGSNLDRVYDTPGNFTYKVPDGVYNIQLSYPTPTGISSFKINNVAPGQEIPITIGEYGTTSSVSVSSSSTYILPAFDVSVLSLVTAIDGWLYLTVSAATPSGQSATVSSNNQAASAAAKAAGAIYEIGYEGYQGTLAATMSLTPVKSEYLTNWPRARIIQTKWGGRNNIRTLGELTSIGGYFTYKFSQNDDNQRGADYYTYGYNLQQILKLTVSPASTGTSIGGLIVSPSSFSANAIVATTYTQQFSASGGNAPYTWATSVGAINSSGLLTISAGTLAAAGTLAVTVTATSANSLTGTITPILNISADNGTGSGGVLSISPTALPGGTVGVAYNQTVTVSGGVAPYNWDVATATTVDGISISASGATLTVAGTPTVNGSVTIPYTITDSSEGGSLSISGSLGFSVSAVAVSAPTVSGISPSSGPRTGGTSVTISGSNFSAATGATIGGVSITSFTALNNTTITGVTGAASSGTVNVIVYNSAGSGSGSGLFTYT